MLREKLKGHPELIHTEVPGGMRIEPPAPTGFSLELREDGDGWMVCLGEAGFHQHFESSEEMLNFVAWCYSGEARLREVWRGSVPQKVMLEAREDGEWRVVSVTGLLLFPFWRPRSEAVLQNANLLRD